MRKRGRERETWVKRDGGQGEGNRDRRCDNTTFYLDTQIVKMSCSGQPTWSSANNENLWR